MIDRFEIVGSKEKMSNSCKEQEKLEKERKEGREELERRSKMLNFAMAFFGKFESF